MNHFAGGTGYRRIIGLFDVENTIFSVRPCCTKTFTKKIPTEPCKGIFSMLN